MNLEMLYDQLTLEEKAKLLTGKKNWFFEGLPRFHVPDFIVGDGPHGLRAYSNLMEDAGYPTKREKATAFPVASAMASSWNKNLMEQVGMTIGKECNHYGVHVLLAPGVNGKRSPLAGRNFEYYSEDPVLTAEMATAFVKGVESQGTGTSVKHFILNEQETDRRFISSEIDEVTFRELYAYPFEKVIKEAKPFSVMSSYNKIHGEYAAHSKPLLTDLLRKEWGYEGLVISDWGGVQDKLDSVKAGLDIEMPESEWKQDFIDAVLSHKIEESLIEPQVRRILKNYQKLLDNPNLHQPTNFDENHQVAVETATQSIVLLKNKDDILPLNKTQKIAIFGEYATHPRIGGGGSSELDPYYLDLPIDAIEKEVKVSYQESYLFNKSSLEMVKDADVVLVFTGTTPQIESEGFDRTDLELPKEQLDFIHQLTKVSSKIVILNSSGACVNVSSFIDNVSGFIQTWFLGSGTGSAIKKILFGEVSPSGRLSETFPLKLSHTPLYANFPSHEDKVEYNEGLFTGYRFYDTHQFPVQFPFGYGLSYASFDYDIVMNTANQVDEADFIQFSITIENTSNIDSYEVIQVYVGSKELQYNRPLKVLKHFEKVFVKANSKKTITTKLTTEIFKRYLPHLQQFALVDGWYQIALGKNVSDIIKTFDIHVTSKIDTDFPIDLKSPAKRWMKQINKYPNAADFFAKYRQLHWWEKEEPMDRIIHRILHENKVDKTEFDDIKNRFIMKKIHR